MSRFEGTVIGCEPPDRPFEFSPVVDGWSVNCESVTDWSAAAQCLDYTEELFSVFVSLIDGVPGWLQQDILCLFLSVDPETKEAGILLRAAVTACRRALRGRIEGAGFASLEHSLRRFLALAVRYSNNVVGLVDRHRGLGLNPKYENWPQKPTGWWLSDGDRQEAKAGEVKSPYSLFQSTLHQHSQ